MITIKHNLDETKFKWLWAKYVRKGDLSHHCNWCIPGAYSKKFSGSTNKDLLKQPILEMDEQPDGSYKAIYFCGVIKSGYSSGKNYPHNFHLAVIPENGRNDIFDFEGWHVEIQNGYVSRIPSESEMPLKFFIAPYNEHFYTCRIFRWMVGYFYPELLRK